MKKDSRLSGVLHVLLHMIASDRPMTSDRMASMMSTHPVVIRRLMAGLRDAGFVSSERGHGGGWVVTCDPATITLNDIFIALDAPPLFAIGHRQDTPQCLVEQAVNAVLDDGFRKAEAVLIEHLGNVTLAALAAEFRGRLDAFHAAKEIDPHEK